MKSFNIKNINLQKMKLPLLGLLIVVIVLWIVLYLIPELFVSLFNTLLGNLLLLLVVLVSYTNNKYVGIGLGIFFIIMYRVVQFSKKEGFTQQSTNDFLEIQNTINRHKVFDMNVIAKQATQEELNFFNTYGLWPWSIQTIELYQSALQKNPYIRTDVHDATNYARTIYNELAILRVLYNQSEEGQFLLNGILVKDPNDNSLEELPSGYGTFPYESGLQKDRTYDIIKCAESGSNLERIKYTGKDGIFGAQTKKRTMVDYNSLESIIPGFKFKDSPCNPCDNGIPNYSCKFSIATKKTNNYI